MDDEAKQRLWGWVFFAAFLIVPPTVLKLVFSYGTAKAIGDGLGIALIIFVIIVILGFAASATDE